MVVKVDWVKCGQGPESHWCNLLKLDLEDKYFDVLEGIYIIWHGQKGEVKAWTVRVGQGLIKDRLIAHINDEEILRYNPYGLYVTWSQVDDRYLDGVERYLGEKLRPKVGSRFPDAIPIEINLPWEEE